MALLTPRLTRRRLLAATALLVVASGIMYMLGADMRSYGSGVIVGLFGVSAIAVLAWKRSNRASPGD